MVFLDTWHQRCRVAALYAKSGFFVFLWSCLCSELRVQPEGAQTGPAQSGFAVSSLLPSVSPAPLGALRSGPKRRLNCSGHSLVLSSALGFLLSPAGSRRGQCQAGEVWNGRRRCPGHSGQGFLQEWQAVPPVPPRSKPHLPSPPVLAGSREGPGYPGDGYSQPAGGNEGENGGSKEESWGCGAGRELTDPPDPSQGLSTALCAWGDFPNPLHGAARAPEPPA